jgi:hypothetical protein
MSGWMGLSMIFGMIFGHGVVILIILGRFRREDRRLFGGHDLMPGWWLAYWIATPLALAGMVGCSVAAA